MTDYVFPCFLTLLVIAIELGFTVWIISGEVERITEQNSGTKIKEDRGLRVIHAEDVEL